MENTNLTTIEEIKQAVDSGKIVHANSTLYVVTKNKYGEYFIICQSNNHAVGLHGRKGTKFEKRLNGTIFFIGDKK